MIWRDRSWIRTGRSCSVAVLALVTGAAAASAQTAVRAVAISTVGSEAVVTIEANGALPAPTLGALDGPPRIFLDFPGVRPATSGIARSIDPRIRRVRIAAFSLNPLITRVVVDLVAQQPHRLEQATGRVMIYIGSSSAAAAAPPKFVPAAAPPAPPAPPTAPPPKPATARREPPSAGRRSGAAPETPPTTRSSPAIDPRPKAPVSLPTEPPAADRIPTVSPLPEPPDDNRGAARPNDAPRPPYRPPATPPSAKDIEKYRAQARNILDRLKLQVPLIEMMQSYDDDVATRLPAAVQEFDRLRDELTAIKPPDGLRVQHDMLIQVTRLAGTAARLRWEAVESNDAAMRRNAISAAAGAALMLDRALVEIGYAGQDGR